MEGKKKFIQILSAGRSGSTILDKAIGSNPLIFSTGEILNFSVEMSRDFTLCGCGNALKECDFWQEIREQFIKDKSIDVFETPERWSIKNLVSGNKSGFSKGLTYLKRHVLGVYSDSENEAFSRTLYLYNLLAKTSKRNILTDSSKSLTRSYVLSKRLKDFDTYFVFLVRDPLGVINSIYKTGYSVEIKDPETNKVERKRFETDFAFEKIEDAVTDWNKYYSKAAVFNKLIKKDRQIFISHEDFTREPAKVLKAICDMVDIPYHSDMENLNNTMNHMLGGNSSRVNAKSIIHSDSKEYKNLTQENIEMILAVTKQTRNKMDKLIWRV